MMRRTQVAFGRLRIRIESIAIASKNAHTQKRKKSAPAIPGTITANMTGAIG
jgi:hypothetical protein